MPRSPSVVAEAEKEEIRRARNALDRAIRSKAYKLGLSEYVLINRVKQAVWDLEEEPV